MQKSLIEIGDKIELELVKSAAGLRRVKRRRYASQLLDFNGVRKAKIAMPISESKVVPLEIGDIYQLCFFTNSGMYQCQCRIVDRYLERTMYVLNVEFTTGLRRFQRRKYYRLDCLFPIRHRKISDIEKVLIKRLDANHFVNDEEREECQAELNKVKREWIDATVSDVSGGGIRFHGNKEWKPGDEIEVYLPLSMNHGIMPVTLMVRVIVSKHYESSRIAYETRGEFVGLEDKQRELIIKYVFEEQRRRLRKDT